MPALSDYQENVFADYYRGGALNAAGTVNSTAVVKGVWTATTAYVVGDIVVPHANMTGAGGKFLQCTTAGTSGSTNTLAVPAVGSTLTDSGVTWTAVSGIPCPLKLYAALLVFNKGLRANSTAYSVGDCISLTPTGGVNGDTLQHGYRCTTAGTSAGSQPGTYLGAAGEVITDGTAVFTELSPVLDAGTGFPAGLTEVTGGSYARVSLAGGAAMTLTDINGTNGTTAVSSGTGGQISNANTITFPAPTANWATGGAQVGAIAHYDQLTGGNIRWHAVLSVPKTINNADPAPTVAATTDTLTLG